MQTLDKEELIKKVQSSEISHIRMTDGFVASTGASLSWTGRKRRRFQAFGPSIACMQVVGKWLTSGFEWFGALAVFCVRVAKSAVWPPYEWREIIRQCDAIGAKSLPLAALAGAATGVVLSLETRDSLVRLNSLWNSPTCSRRPAKF
jgi:hypothetical protein